INYTGAEANVAVSLSVMGEKTDFVTKMPDSDISACAIKMLKSYGVGIDNIVTGGDRLGLYYLERGASQRASKIIYDRKYSAISMARRDEFDWKKIFKDAGVFHFTGITAGLGGEMAEICIDACREAKKAGLLVTCDLNYRRALWSKDEARQVMGNLMPYVDVLICNEEDAACVFGMSADGSDIIAGKLNDQGYSELARKIKDVYGVPAVAFTLRTSISASDNDWAGMLFINDQSYFSRKYRIHLVDRVGGGDSFSAAVIYVLNNRFEPQKAIEFAVAASCLKQTIEMDFNLATVEEIERLMEGDGSGRVVR
ncbi:MAG TPA: sugar kinase, partial [Anaerovoracaceae bacterium]|nr:sugar kinase [Anaerovoracaceae bacterium]